MKKLLLLLTVLLPITVCAEGNFWEDLVKEGVLVRAGTAKKPLKVYYIRNNKEKLFGYPKATLYADAPKEPIHSSGSKIYARTGVSSFVVDCYGGTLAIAYSYLTSERFTEGQLYPLLAPARDRSELYFQAPQGEKQKKIMDLVCGKNSHKARFEAGFILRSLGSELFSLRCLPLPQAPQCPDC